MRVGIDSYSYHRLFGEVRVREEPHPGPLWPPDPTPILEHARRLGVDEVYDGEENEVEVPGWDEATPDRGLHWLDKDKRRRKIMEPVSEMCTTCNGTGQENGGDCETCEGLGYIDTGQMQPVTEPVLLDGAGKELGRDGEGDLLPCVVLVFSVLPETDFTGIGIS